MSTKPDDETPKLGSRENYWGGSEEPSAAAYDVDDEDTTDMGHSEHAGVTRDKVIAGTILRGAPETSLVCPHCFTELTDPEHYVEPSEVEIEITDEAGDVVETRTELRYADHRRHRHCPTCAEIAWGGILADVEAPVFLEIVERVLAAIDAPIDADDAEALLEGARERKSAGLSDEANLERVLLDVRRRSSDSYS